ncbi:MAG TPA: N-acetylglucosamine-6-phosphate deacetylase [Candidatus Hydrogenedentes bacterium]|nr:N-acetylglucosamine-6-phosphate deacetylase [Candidatus Hydrogenedentota bacterium]HOJ69786.1 N-acetylglucosamine-6-phosphate deacetylase [Candidatus Hydrogenedentota bacterium]HOK88603.1 N-acetylglucosamine-6-phosphate deacetylase [Candidatus Hydrogenedentota bacterium]
MIADARHVFSRQRIRIDLARGTADIARGSGGEPFEEPPERVFCPPLIDLQVNGGFGVNLQDPSLTEADFLVLCRGLAREGVAAWLPTLITDATDALERKAVLVGGFIRNWPRHPAAQAGARPVGLHLEGPFISPEDGARGAHPREHAQPASIETFRRIMVASGETIRYLTLAPEVPGGLALISRVHEQDPRLLIGIGHTLADGETIRAAAEAGARLSTHLGNGLPALTHRHRNPVWPQLAEDRLVASFIPDLCHLPGDTLAAMIRAKGPGRFLFVSDAVSLAGEPPGTYTLFGATVEKKPDGRVCLAGTDLLAGSGTLLLESLSRAAGHGVLSLETAWEGGYSVPVRLLGGMHWTVPFSAEGRILNGILLRRVDHGQDGAEYAPEAVWINGCRAR